MLKERLLPAPPWLPLPPATPAPPGRPVPPLPPLDPPQLPSQSQPEPLEPVEPVAPVAPVPPGAPAVPSAPRLLMLLTADDIVSSDPGYCAVTCAALTVTAAVTMIWPPGSIVTVPTLRTLGELESMIQGCPAVTVTLSAVKT